MKDRTSGRATAGAAVMAVALLCALQGSSASAGADNDAGTDADSAPEHVCVGTQPVGSVSDWLSDPVCCSGM